jgi:type I site-specific restriction-modification system R (restriction) subunit
MSTGVVESTVEEAALSWFQELGFAIVHGPDIAPGELFTERQGYGDVVLVKRLREAIVRINPKIPQDAIEEAIRRILHPETASLIETIAAFTNSSLKALMSNTSAETELSLTIRSNSLISMIPVTTTGPPSTSSP